MGIISSQCTTYYMRRSNYSNTEHQLIRRKMSTNRVAASISEISVGGFRKMDSKSIKRSVLFCNGDEKIRNKGNMHRRSWRSFYYSSHHLPRTLHRHNSFDMTAYPIILLLMKPLPSLGVIYYVYPIIANRHCNLSTSTSDGRAPSIAAMSASNPHKGMGLIPM